MVKNGGTESRQTTKAMIKVKDDFSKAKASFVLKLCNYRIPNMND